MVQHRRGTALALLVIGQLLGLLPILAAERLWFEPNEPFARIVPPVEATCLPIQRNRQKAWRMTVSKPKFGWGASLEWRYAGKKALAAGDLLQLSCSVRNAGPRPAEVLCFITRRDGPDTSVPLASWIIEQSGAEWEPHHLVATIAEAAPADRLEANLQFGDEVQSVEIADVRIDRLKNGTKPVGGPPGQRKE